MSLASAVDTLSRARHRPLAWAAFACVDLAMSVAVIQRVSYTEIDWRAYMQEVEGPLLHGQWDYAQLSGDTGPLVYPAGFVWVFMGLRALTDEGRDVRCAQYLFAVLHALVVFLVLGTIYYKEPEPQFAPGTEPPQKHPRARRQACDDVPLWVGALLICSRRVRSVFVLRLFNDCVAMVAVYLCLFLLVRRRWNAACACFSAALSLKMNILLFAPGLAVVLLQTGGLGPSVARGAAVFASQLAVAVPFLCVNARGYFERAFEFGRVFTFKWTVNFKFLPEHIFVSKGLALATLLAMLVVWLIFGHTHFARWTHPRSGLLGLIVDSIRRPTVAPIASASGDKNYMLRGFVHHATLVLLTSNFIGIVFARSIHYQFYAWYYHSLGYLAYRARLGPVTATALILAIELCYNVFPATPATSALLQAAHFTLLAALFWREDSRKKAQWDKRE